MNKKTKEIYRFVVEKTKSKNPQRAFKYQFIAPNNESMITVIFHNSKQGVLKAIETLKRTIPNAPIIDKTLKPNKENENPKKPKS